MQVMLQAVCKTQHVAPGQQQPPWPQEQARLLGRQAMEEGEANA